MAGLGEVIDLEPLDEPTIREILVDLRPGAPASDLAHWVRGASGNPLIATLAAAGGSGPRPAESMLDAMVGRLTADELELVTRLALHGLPLPLTPAEVARPRLEPLIETTAPGLYTLRHDLIAEAVLRRVAPERQDAIHATLAQDTSDASLRAFHLASAGDPKASGVARHRGAGGADRRRPTRLLALAVECGDADDPILRLDAAEALSRTGRYRDAIELLENTEFADRLARSGREIVLSVAYWTEALLPQTRMALARGTALNGDAATPELVDLLTIEVGILTRIEWDAEASIALGERTVALAVETRHGEGRAVVRSDSRCSWRETGVGWPRWNVRVNSPARRRISTRPRPPSTPCSSETSCRVTRSGACRSPSE